MRRSYVLIFIYILIVIFFLNFFRGIDLAKIIQIEISPIFLIVSALFSLAYRYWGALVWRTILKGLGSENLPDFSFLSYTYAKSWMARYIPGTISWIASKVFIAQEAGISKSRLAVSSIIEAGIQIVALASISSLLLLIDVRGMTVDPKIWFSAIATSLLLTIILLPKVFNKFVTLGLRIFDKDSREMEVKTTLKALTHSYALYVIGAFFSGASYFFIVKAIQPSIGLSEFLYITAVFNIAGALGMMTPLVPAGLGVRDGVQLFFLSQMFPKEMALVIVIFSRLWSALIDILFFVITLIIDKFTRLQ